MKKFSLLEPEKYYAFPPSWSAERKDSKITEIAASDKYLWSLKTDGNWTRFVKEDGIALLQTRGISTKTGTYGEIQEKVLFFDTLKTLFSEPTCLIGEVFMEGGDDKSVGAILRCLPPKAIIRQKETPLKLRIFDVYAYNGIDLMKTPMSERVKILEEIRELFKDNPLIEVVHYYQVDTSLKMMLDYLIGEGEEGMVLTKKDAIPEPGKRTAWKTLKLKPSEDFDCFIAGIEPSSKETTTKNPETWPYWYNSKTNEKSNINHFGEEDWEPTTKGFYLNWPGAIKCGVFDKDGKVYILCNCASLTDELREALATDYQSYHMMPIKISGMAVSVSTPSPSIRHPRFISLRDGDINIESCTLEKIFN